MAGPRKVSISIDMKKLEKDLKKEFVEVSDKLLKSVTPRERRDLGYLIVEEMKAAIAKGLSPIKSKGRFAAYKWAAVKNSVAKSYRSSIKDLKGDKSKNAKNYKRNLRSGKDRFETSINSKYPFSMKKKFPGKKERPVNLKLSGDFLETLEAKATPKGLEVGFYDPLSVKKEMGHRVGVNKQPSRPIIPNENEEFSASIYRRFLEKLTQTLKRKKIRT